MKKLSTSSSSSDWGWRRTGLGADRIGQRLGIPAIFPAQRRVRMETATTVTGLFKAGIECKLVPKEPLGDLFVDSRETKLDGSLIAPRITARVSPLPDAGWFGSIGENNGTNEDIPNGGGASTGSEKDPEVEGFHRFSGAPVDFGEALRTAERSRVHLQRGTVSRIKVKWDHRDRGHRGPSL